MQPSMGWSSSSVSRTQPNAVSPRRASGRALLVSKKVGLEPLTDGTWNVFFGPIHLGWLDERDYRIHDYRGRATRRRKLSLIR